MKSLTCAVQRHVVRELENSQGQQALRVRLQTAFAGEEQWEEAIKGNWGKDTDV